MFWTSAALNVVMQSITASVCMKCKETLGAMRGLASSWNWRHTLRMSENTSMSGAGTAKPMSDGNRTEELFKGDFVGLYWDVE
jgi:hypothetical protein